MVNKLNLADQAESTFSCIWPEAMRGKFTGTSKEKDAHVVFATVQSIANSLTDFTPSSFEYIVVDECHHAAAKTYQKISN